MYELLSRADQAADKQRTACALFAEGLSAFRCRAWPDAKEKFEASTKLLDEDRLSRFYLKLFDQYKNQPPMEPWEGVVELEEK